MNSAFRAIWLVSQSRNVSAIRLHFGDDLLCTACPAVEFQRVKSILFFSRYTTAVGVWGISPSLEKRNAVLVCCRELSCPWILGLRKSVAWNPRIRDNFREGNFPAIGVFPTVMHLLLHPIGYWLNTNSVASSHFHCCELLLHGSVQNGAVSTKRLSFLVAVSGRWSSVSRVRQRNKLSLEKSRLWSRFYRHHEWCQGR